MRNTIDPSYTTIGMLFEKGETPENFHSFYDQYKNAYETRKKIIDNLYHEIKIIKKLRV